MKNGKLVPYLVIVVVVVFSAALIALAATKPPDEITIKPAIWPSPTKGAVTFSHKKHVAELKLACTQCHHIWKDGKNVFKEGDDVKQCDSCHTEATVTGETKLPPDQQKLNLKIAFHKNCQPCHIKTKSENPQSKAPTMCPQCHGAK